MDGQNQSILVSGESGAGKTETVKILMSHIASIQAGGGYVVGDSIKRNLEETFAASPIVQRVLDSNPLLEAFGNAKTVRNDNSSRFGKFIQLQFDAEDPTHAAYAGKSIPSCVLAGSKSEVYLLEKSRVVGHEEEERTYHIFYQLLAAPEEIKTGFWEGLEDTDNESFSYVGWTDTNVIEGKDDAERFQLTVDALALVGVQGEKLRTLMRAICIVLQLGNLTFEPNKEDEEKTDISSVKELQNLAGLMGVEQQDIQNSLTQRTVRARNEEYKVPLKAVQARDSCDAFAKEIYAKAFLWLVRTINNATCAENNYDRNVTGGFAIIGLLDIFGFESFETNRFEQLCINYANEKLQQKFTQDIFRSVQAEYEEEGIALGEITYEDNRDVLDLVEGRMGLIAVLNEECVRPKGNDTAFVSKVQAMNKDSDCLISEKSFRDYEFGVKHYAGPVIYEATNFVSKNMDNLPKDLLECAEKSTNDIVSEALTNDEVMASAPSKAKKRPNAKAGHPKRSLTRKGSTLVQESVWGKFRNQLTSLMASLSETRTRYIRCIKPNTEKLPKLMQHLSTVEQLRCAGVVAAVTISRSAFPNRLEHEIVLDRFKSLWTKGHHSTSVGEGEDTCDEDQRRNVEDLLSSALKSLEVKKNGETVKSFVIGNTRAYFRVGALEYLESERLKGLSTWSVEIQRIVRGFLVHSRYRKQRKAAIEVETSIRTSLARKRYVRFRNACIAIQCLTRCSMARAELVRLRADYRATMIQTHWRMAMAVVLLKVLRKAAIAIQAIARGAIQRPKYRRDIVEKREEAKLENQLKSLQRKLEEAESRRIQAEKEAEDQRIEAEKKAKEAPEPVVVYRERPPTAEEANEETESVKKPVVEPPPVVTVAPPPVVGQLTEQQQNLMDESGKMLEYLRKEVFKLRSQNSQLRTDFDLLKENNQRLMDANASAGASFAALNQHAKQLNKTNARLVADLSSHKEQIHKLNLAQVELKEELKMKQATCEKPEIGPVLSWACRVVLI